MTNQNSAAQTAEQDDIAQRLRDQANHYAQDPGYMADAALNRAAADEIDRLNAKLRTPVAPEPFRAAFANGALPATRFHELWESAAPSKNSGHTMLEDLTWQVGKFAALVAAEVRAPVADERAAFSRAEISFPLTIPENRVYLAGPMTGYKDHNFPAFHDAAEWLRGAGLEVVNPADHGLVDGLGWSDYMRWDLVKLAGCHAVYVLPDWEKSKGASLEVSIAQALGMPVFTIEGAPLASAPVAAPSDETLRLAGVIADKIEDGTLFQAGILSRRELADKVRAVVRSVREASAPVAEQSNVHGLMWNTKFDPQERQRAWAARQSHLAQGDATVAAKEKVDKILRDRMAPISGALGLDVMFASAGNGAIRIFTFKGGPLIYTIRADGSAILRVSLNQPDAPGTLTVDQVKTISQCVFNKQQDNKEQA